MVVLAVTKRRSAQKLTLEDARGAASCGVFLSVIMGRGDCLRYSPRDFPKTRRNG
jgi:hypothetical protein